jgi:energy-coupling factor transport system permease protein
MATFGRPRRSLMVLAARAVGDSFLVRRDPRVLIVVPACMVVVAVQILDLRLMTVVAVTAFAYYWSARIPFGAVRSNWIFVGLFVMCFATANGLVTGAHRTERPANVIFTVPLIDIPVSAVSVSYAVLIMLRLMVITATGFPLAFIVRPGDLAVAVARLGVPARFAYGVGLTFRFLPTMTASLQDTVSAQRLRGYEVTPTRNPFRRFRQLQPLIVPTVVSAFIRAEDVADALDLRGFGARHRTWVRTLRFGSVDFIVIGLAVLVAIAASAATLSGHMPGLWTPSGRR